MRERLRASLTYANVMSTIAVFAVLAGGGAYAASKIGSQDIKRAAVGTKHLKVNAVNSKRVRNFGLRLRDLGGKANRETRVLANPIIVPDDGCVSRTVAFANPTPRGLVGSLVVGHVTDAAGDAVLDNNGVVVPTMVSETSQGGAMAKLVVCDSGDGQNIPAGSVFRYHLIGP